MSKRLDDALAALDVGLQTPHPDPSFGEVSPRVSDRCARCDRADAAHESEFCAPCRGFLLGDRADPMLPSMRPLFHPTFGEFGTPSVSAGGLPVAIRDAWQRMADALAATIAAVADWWNEHRGLFVESLTFGVAADVLEGRYGWPFLVHVVREQVYMETCAYPVLTVDAIPDDDPLRVVVRVEWSRFDPVFNRSYADVERPDDWTPLNVGLVRDITHSMATNDLMIFAEPRLPVCRIMPPREQ